MSIIKTLIYDPMPGNAALKLLSVFKPGCAGQKNSGALFFCRLFSFFFGGAKKKR